MRYGAGIKYQIIRIEWKLSETFMMMIMRLWITPYDLNRICSIGRIFECPTIYIKLQRKQPTSALSLSARAASLLWITGTKLSDEQQSRMLSNSERFCLPEIAPLNFSRGKLYPALLFYPFVSNPPKNFDDGMMLWKLVLDKFVEITISVYYFMRNWSISWKISELFLQKVWFIHLFSNVKLESREQG